MPFVGRGWWLESVGCGLLRSHIAELSVRFARLAGGSAIAERMLVVNGLSEEVGVDSVTQQETGRRNY